ncbi:hypothetical protein [Desulfosporosinus youngiae]|uniref:PIN domain-containing protein n=1 Tax=Desulfosporosinus youngiae DSM 17734 TaxID=768710 RepID=H5XYV1_9FIRM|nr:hypothetical protein [Desulfosporosinus youngiae]EHQ91657.1 hypothetical protein DesyoDRAFT_4705 [Desulfosporosinus youngiae DSM 17734]
MKRVLFDTTVLCGAIISLGVNYKLIQLARSAEFFEPVISEVVVCEFIEHCRKGLKGVVYSESEMMLSLQLLHLSWILKTLEG